MSALGPKAFEALGYRVLVVGSAADLFRTDGARFSLALEYPFLRSEWLTALEESGAAGAASGWVPRHFLFYRGSELLAFVPAYVKSHSMGEFVFDHAIAEFAELRLGLRYYPKLVFGVPFTPATGPRLVMRAPASDAQRELLAALGALAPRICSELRVSSLHWLFGTEEEVRALDAAGFLTRSGLQFQFKNRGFKDFEDYLGSFRAKKRAQVRRERRELGGVAFEILSGADLGRVSPELLYRLYLTTVDKHVWGRRYLNQSFFERVVHTMPEALHVVLARTVGTTGDDGVLGAAFNLLGKHALYGRYWGAFAEIPFLHFETCLYRGIEETIQRGLERFEPGAGGEHKESRGFEATLTQSAHFFSDQRLTEAVAEFFERERAAISARVQAGSAADDG
jgi:uncharacterized protein